MDGRFYDVAFEGGTNSLYTSGKHSDPELLKALEHIAEHYPVRFVNSGFKNNGSYWYPQWRLWSLKELCGRTLRQGAHFCKSLQQYLRMNNKIEEAHLDRVHFLIQKSPLPPLDVHELDMKQIIYPRDYIFGDLCEACDEIVPEEIDHDITQLVVTQENIQIEMI